MELKQKIYNLLRWSQKYTQTDMVYLAKGGFWLTLEQIISIVSGFLLAIAFANLLPKETYGTYRYVLSLASILAIPTLSGMNTAIVRAVARGYEGSFIPALKTKLRWGILTTLASLGLAGYYFFHENITLTFCFLIVAAFLPSMRSFTLYSSFWQGRKRFDIKTKYGFISQIVAVSTLVIALFLTKNLFLILSVYFISHTLLYFIFLQITIKKSNLNQKHDPQTISYGKHLSLMGIIGIVTNQLDKLLLWHFLGAAPVAIYSFAVLPPAKIKATLQTIGGLALPKFSQRSKQELKTTLPKKIFKLFLLIIPIIVLYIIFAPFIYKIIFPQYLDSVIYSQVFVFFLIVTIPTTLLSTSFLAQMKKKELYIYQTVSPIIQIILLLTLVPLYGIWGAIFALLITRFSNLGLLLFLFKRM